MAVVFFHPGLLTDTGNSAFIMLAVIGVTLVVFRSAEPGRTARQVLSGLYWGAILVWLIGMGEIVTGVKLLPLLYPRANTLGAVSKNRWVVTATYPNYNDYGVV
ncbi:O-antigen ligase domain-containing protein, partial [Xanthomonas citri pv. citri]|nr:O-antigen ligase domain-containing protein [Xanthomonas citri pv. citri]